MALSVQRRRPAARSDAGGTPAYPALLLAQNQHRFYFATIPVHDLFPYCFVSRRNEDPAAGFQRTLNESRADDIAIYLAAGNGSIPTNIVLSAQPGAAFTYDRRTKSVSFQRVPSAFLVLDGQHRLWGYHKCSIEHRVPVAIYEGLTRAIEAKLFIDINTNQRGVPASLLLDIKQIAQIESAREAILRDWFDALKNDPKAPLVGRLSPSQSVAGKISRVAFNRALSPVLDGGVIPNLPDAQRYKLLVNYLNAFDAELSNKRLLFKAAFFEAIWDLFDEVVRITLSQQQDVKQESLQEVIRLLARIDFAGIPHSKKAYVATLQAALRKTVTISQDML